MSNWRHAFVQAQFDGELINRRKLYPPELRDVLERTYALRQIADYASTQISQSQSTRALRRTRTLLETVQVRGR